MTKKVVFRKSMVIGIILLFVGASVIPSISGGIRNVETNQKENRTSKNVIFLDKFDDAPKPIWDVGQTWWYEVNALNINQQGVFLNADPFNLRIEVTEKTTSSYKLSFDGDITADISFDAGWTTISGRLLNTEIDGWFHFDNGDIGLMKVTISIDGTVDRGPGHSIRNVPFNLHTEVEPKNVYNLFDFPISEGETWTVPSEEFDVSIIFKIKFLGQWLTIIDDTGSTITDEHTVRCVGVETVNGFEAFHVKGIGDYWYSPSIENIVKLEGSFDGIEIDMEYGRINGIDVSHHNGVIDWQKVKDSGKVFAMIKATGGTGFRDGELDNNAAGAEDNDLLFGVYHFIYPEYNSAEAEAAWFIDNAGDYIKPGNLRPFMDLENDPNENSYPYQMEVTPLTDWILDFFQAVEDKKGVQPIIYAPWYDYVDFLKPEEDRLKDLDLWIADTYHSNSPYTGLWDDWGFWQYDIGSVPGINGDVDLNVFNGGMHRLKDFLIIDLDITKISGGLVIIKATIKNNGDGDGVYTEFNDGDATDIEWSIKLEGGNIIRPPGRIKEGIINEIKAGDVASIFTFVYGFGIVNIIVEASCPNGLDTATASALVLGPFVVIL
ncbi:MAG: glycoside hydrolase family 25 protein [Thermoplasmatales archaeon]|nr:glycoside hydrolase family 25 protein [Thermoplasmatales archaeon]